MKNKEPKKKSIIGRIFKVILILFLLFIAAVVGLGIYYKKESDREEREKLHATLKWPTTTKVSELLPKPDSDVGCISWEYDDSIHAEIPDVTQSQFNEYVAKCSDSGFTVDFYKSDSTYYADNSDGYHVSLSLRDDVMKISLDAPTEKSDETDDETPTPEATEPAEVPTETPEAETETAENQSSDNAANSGIRPEIKEAIDTYESFMNDYCDFMVKYADSDDTVSMLKDYADYTLKYTEAVEKFDNLEDDNLSDEELKYYIEVQTRVNQKLANAAIDIQ